MHITLLRYVNDVTQTLIRQRKLLAKVDVTLPRGEGLDHITFQCFALRNASS